MQHQIRVRSLVVVSFALLVGGLACEAPIAPEQPAWDTDVFPILRGNCLHCHGSDYEKAKVGIFRFDVCDGKAPAFTTAGVSAGPIDVVSIMPTIVEDVIAKAGQRPKMPPPPAAALSDYEIEVLKNWDKLVKVRKADACKKAISNQKPVAVLVGKVRKEGTTLSVEVDVSDEDGDAVFGKASAGGTPQEFSSAGRKKWKFENASGDKVTLKLTDGYEVVDLTLP